MKCFHKCNPQLLRAGQHDFITQVELGVRFGKTVVVTDALDIDPAFAPLLRQEFSHQGPRRVVQLGEKTVDVNEDFRIFFCTKDDQIRLPSFAKSALAVANFSTTRSGLASQLLSLAIETEQPELEVRSSQLTSQAETMKVQLDELEQILLNELVNAEGSILENTQLLDSLNKSKENAETIAKSLAESELLHKQLDEQRAAYMPFAEKCAQLYFAISDLHRHNHMYNFNVSMILKLFRKTFSGSQSESNITARLEAYYRTLQRRVYEYVSRALFKDDRLMFAISFIRHTSPGAFDKNEWELFSGLLVGESREDYAIKSISWIDDDRRADVSRLQTFLPTLFHTLSLDDKGTWNAFAKSPTCESEFPSSIDARLTPFQRVLVVQALRPDRLHSAMTKFACSMLSMESLSPSALDLQLIHKDESSPTEPILLATAAGADPTQELTELAAKTIGLGRFRHMAMGHSQQQAAVDALRKSIEQGDWLYLSNLHLVLGFVPTLQKEFSARKPHDDFRLWLTAEADDRFPAVFLQEALKLSFESPPGIRNNLERTYAQWTQSSDRQQVAQHNTSRMQALLVLAWLHAILQERRTFIPQAWLKFYEFGQSDLRAGKHVIDVQYAKGSQADWETVRGLMENAIYGGRIENSLDIGVLQAYLETFFSSRLITGTDAGARLAPGVDLPALSALDEYPKWLHSRIPVEDNPTFFGLPRNIVFSWEISKSAESIAKLRHLQTQATAKSGFSRDAWNTMLSPILNLWKRLNQHSNMHAMDEPAPTPSDDPIAEVLSLEFVHAVRLMRHVHGSLTLISKAIKGTLVPDVKTVQLAQSLIAHKTPDAWDSLWSGPENPIAYLEALVYKAKSTKELAEQSTSGDLLSRPVNFAQLFRPSTLLNAFRQLSARRKQASMDTLKLVTECKSQTCIFKEPSSMGASYERWLPIRRPLRPFPCSPSHGCQW
ncbi:cytoplasmic dynein 2 heavy chain 1-like protein [Aphelenchoides avenae]|nr:cytoplasmic dynein 2 heavy chain 1-like protein [Aphelenchus avenae]